jgi:hypothetical protein
VWSHKHVSTIMNAVSKLFYGNSMGKRPDVFAFGSMISLVVPSSPGTSQDTTGFPCVSHSAYSSSPKSKMSQDILGHYRTLSRDITGHHRISLCVP